MGHSMLGPHINAKADQIPWLQRAQPRVGKVLLQAVDPEWLRQAKAASPHTFWVGRLYVESQPLDNPQQNAQDFCDRLLPAAEPFRGLVDALEGYNEVGFTSFKSVGALSALRRRAFATRAAQIEQARQEMQGYALFERTRCERLSGHGWQSVVGNFSAGTPEIELWPDFYPALEAGQYLGLHEYSANNQPPYLANLESWLCRRYRRVYEALPESLHRPLIITECGIDGGVIGQPQLGWRRYTNEPGYLAELRWYDEGLQEDAGDRLHRPWPIVGATIYLYGHVGSDWETFEIGGPMSGLLGDYMQSNPPLAWQPPAVGSPDPLVETLSQALGEEFDDIRNILVRTGDYPPRDVSVIRYLVFDHTGPGTTPQTYSNVIARSHVENLGWPGIGYHFLVYPHKVRYTGSLNTARPVVFGREAETVNIGLVGNFAERAPDPHTLELARRLAELLERHLGHSIPRVGHRDVALPGHETDSPGATAYGPEGWLRQLLPEEARADEIAQLQARIVALELEREQLTAEVERLRELLRRVRGLVE